MFLMSILCISLSIVSCAVPKHGKAQRGNREGPMPSNAPTEQGGPSQAPDAKRFASLAPSRDSIAEGLLGEDKRSEFAQHCAKMGYIGYGSVNDDEELERAREDILDRAWLAQHDELCQMRADSAEYLALVRSEIAKDKAMKAEMAQELAQETEQMEPESVEESTEGAVGPN